MKVGKLIKLLENYKDFKVEKRFAKLKESDKIIFLLHALSSPNGKPICWFLEEKIKFIGDEKHGYKKTVETINHASTLFNLLTKQIENGKSFDEILIKLNDKYNKLIKNYGR